MKSSTMLLILGILGAELIYLNGLKPLSTIGQAATGGLVVSGT